MTAALLDTMQVTCNDCGYSGTIARVQLHNCDIVLNGGRCEDYPACGHIDGDGCQTLPEHTADFYHRNPHLMYEPGSPEWHDAMADLVGDDPPDWWCKGCDTDYDDTSVFDDGDRIADHCIHCRVRYFISETMDAHMTRLDGRSGKRRRF